MRTHRRRRGGLQHLGAGVQPGGRPRRVEPAASERHDGARRTQPRVQAHDARLGRRGRADRLDSRSFVRGGQALVVLRTAESH